MAIGSLREFSISCPPCVEAGEADWVYFYKILVRFFGFANNFLMRHRGKLGSTQKNAPGPNLSFFLEFFRIKPFLSGQKPYSIVEIR